MLRRKARSDAEPPVAFSEAEEVESSDACKEEARSSKAATWDADWEITGADVVESGGRKLNQSGDVGTSCLALEDDAAELLGILGWTVNALTEFFKHATFGFPRIPPSHDQENFLFLFQQRMISSLDSSGAEVLQLIASC